MEQLRYLLDAVLFQLRRGFIEHSCELVDDGLEQSHEAGDLLKRMTIHVRADRSSLARFVG